MSPPGGVFSLEIVERRPGIAVFTYPESSIFNEESGGHRWQRIPPTERNGRVQTSTVTVAVLPEADEREVPIRESDLEWSTTRSGGKGGQNVNKVESCVQLRHRPSGLFIRCETERSQLRNKTEALRILRAKLKQRADAERHGNIDNNRREQVGSGMRGDKRRTIQVKHGVVKDHITGREWRYDRYVKGDW